MSNFLSIQLFKVPVKTWLFIILFYGFPALLDLIDFNDLYFHNILWFLYLIPTLFLTFLHGSKYGILSTGAGSLLFLLTESLQPSGIVSQGLITLAELILVNVLITVIVGQLVKRNNRELGRQKELERQLGEAKADLEYIAFHDSLTGLYNLNYFSHRLTKQFEENKINRIPACLMFFNLDRFKLINDSYGHPFGDQILKLVAEKLLSLIEPGGTAVRSGGDDFILYLPETLPDQAKELANRILMEFSKPIHFGKIEIRLSASIGIVHIQEEDSLEVSLQKASSSLHFAKETGRNKYQFYSAKFVEAANRRLLLEQGLRKALEEKRLKVFYQPKFDLHLNQITGLEALLRWNDPVLGNVSPDEFIPVAEETGLIIPIGKWVLEEASRQVLEWQKMGYSDLHVCVNISSIQFLQNDFTKMIEQIIRENSLQPQSLNLEITERIALYNIEDTIQKLQHLQQFGVTISLDDFGTGYSSLSYIKSLPINFLKIDRSFIKDIFFNHQDAAIIRSIISLAQSLDFKVVAEGVETDDQLRVLGEMGCNEIQGYYIAKPMASEDFSKFLEHNLVKHYSYQ